MQQAVIRGRPYGLEEISEEEFAKIVRVIVEAIDPEQIILFGSRAGGDFRRDSDLDLLIVDSQPFDTTRSRRKEITRIGDLLDVVPLAIDILLHSREEVEYWRDSLNNVVARALREGRVLYERS
ncbi:MAG: nucleotidyltransferase domain-containing protein [Pseudomonadota bacterium]